MSAGLDIPAGKHARSKGFGWFAHADRACSRCGGQLGPFSSVGEFSQEFWGCAECGVGVFCSGEDQPNCDQAADIFVSMMR